MSGKRKVNKSVQLKRIQGLIRAERYILTDHASVPIKEGDFDIDDLECSIKNGEIKKIENDKIKQAKDGKIYTIVGPTFSGLPIATVGKIIGEPEEEYLLITAYINI